VEAGSRVIKRRLHVPLPITFRHNEYSTFALASVADSNSTFGTGLGSHMDNACLRWLTFMSAPYTTCLPSNAHTYHTYCPQTHFLHHGHQRLSCLAHKRRFYAYYNHYDSYPRGLGVQMWAEVPRGLDDEAFERWANERRTNLEDAAVGSGVCGAHSASP